MNDDGIVRQTHDTSRSLMSARENSTKSLFGPNTFLRPYGEFMCGAVGSGVATTFTHPLDLLKTRVQTAALGSRVRLWPTALGIMEIHGVRGLYAGFSASILRSLTFSSARLGSYNHIKHLTTHHLRDMWAVCSTYTCSIIAGAGAGAFASVIGNPAETIKVKMQSGEHSYRGLGHAFAVIFKTEGLLRGLAFKGLLAHTQRSALWAAVQLSTYDSSKRTIGHAFPNLHPLGLYFCASILASVATVACSAPFDLAKARLQNQGFTHGHQSITTLLFQIIRHDGMLALWRGSLPNIIRSAPHATVMFVVNDALLSWCGYAGLGNA
jgi:hypothetical protein